MTKDTKDKTWGLLSSIVPDVRALVVVVIVLAGYSYTVGGAKTGYDLRIADLEEKAALRMKIQDEQRGQLAALGESMTWVKGSLARIERQLDRDHAPADDRGASWPPGDLSDPAAVADGRQGK